MPLTIELPPRKSLLAFNRKRWAELIADPSLARLPGRIETDRYGHIIMSPPASHSHGGQQSDLAFLLKTHLPRGRTLVECPISTADGIKVADVAWISLARLEIAGQDVCLTIAPEICVEVLSPSNTKREIAEKTALYFEAGAREVWLCSPKGRLTFFLAPDKAASPGSEICPPFPRQIPE
jgi:Uma2 family endonuclease